MSRLEIDWPDEGAERVRAAQGRLALAGRGLREMSLEERIQAVARVLEDWTAPDSPWRRELADSLGGLASFSPGTVAEGLESALRVWRPERFIACARGELALESGALERELVPFDSTTVLAGGAIPMPTILSALLPLVLGSPVLLRETSKDPVTPGLLARSLEARDDRLARSFENLSFRATDAAAFERALEAPCVMATGSDETIASISRRLDRGQRFVAYGHKFSIALLGPGVARDSTRLREAAEGIALDVARWDQSGCLSPVVVYLMDLEQAVAERIANEISQALELLSTGMPRGEVSAEASAEIATERAEARMRSASGMGLLLEGSEHTVTLEVDSRPRPAPLHRFLRLMPVESPEALIQALLPFAGKLSNLAIEGFAPERRTNSAPMHPVDTLPADLLARLAQLGVSRVTKPGRLQTPPVDWPHDGMPLFTPLARFMRFRKSDSIRV